MNKKLSIVLGLAAFLLPFSAFADIGTPMNTNGANENTYVLFNGIPELIVYQTLGTSLQGTVSAIAAVPYFSFSNGSTNWSAQIQCFTDAAYSIGCVNSSVGTTSISSANVGQWATSTISAYTLSTSNYYRLRLAMDSRVSGTYTQMFYNFVSPADPYPAGTGNAGNGSTQGGTLTDYVFNLGSASAFFDSTTHIATVTPADNATISTSTTATMGATGYVNPADYVSGMFVQMKYALYANSQVSVANPSALFTTINFPITSSGLFSFSTTTPITRGGQYTLTTQIRSASLANNVLNFLGFDQFATFGITTSKSTKFTAAAFNGFDTFVASTTASITDYLASSTISLATCSSWTSFNLGDCLNLIFVPALGPMQSALNDFKTGFLSYAPWGYVTRMVVILSGTATTTLPTINVTIPLGNPSRPEYTNGTFTIDPNDTLSGGAALLETVHTTFGGDFSVRTVTEPFVKLSIALTVLMAVFYDLIGMAHHRKLTRNGKLS